MLHSNVANKVFDSGQARNIPGGQHRVWFSYPNYTNCFLSPLCNVLLKILWNNNNFEMQQVCRENCSGAWISRKVENRKNVCVSPFILTKIQKGLNTSWMIWKTQRMINPIHLIHVTMISTPLSFWPCNISKLAHANPFNIPLIVGDWHKNVKDWLLTRWDKWKPTLQKHIFTGKPFL